MPAGLTSSRTSVALRAMSSEPQAGLAEHATAAIAVDRDSRNAHVHPCSAPPGRLRFPRMGSATGYCDSAMDLRRRHVVKRGALATLAVLALAGAAVAAPPGKPPKPAGVPGAPPPAWIDAGAAEKWLAYSSYCWKVACVDYVSPEMRKDLPVLTIRRGQPVTLHLGFVPSQLSVSQGKKTRSLVRRAKRRPGDRPPASRRSSPSGRRAATRATPCASRSARRA